jgi:ATP phosphoribosyltransferase
MTTEPKQRIKIAIQKKGRLHDDTLNMFKNAGFRFTRDSTGFIMPCENAEFDLVLLRDDDIPTAIGQCACELGIVGRNTLHEDICEEKFLCDGRSFTENNTIIIKELPFGKCRLSLAGNTKLSFSDIFGKRVATSYQYTLLDYQKRFKDSIVYYIKLKGSVEIAPRLGIADAICDLVSSGMTLKENNLIEGETILHSTAILIANKNFNQNNETYKQIIEAIEENTSAKDKKYIMFNCEEKNLEEILKIIDFVESPTVMPLAKKNMNAVHIMCNESDFKAVHHKLKQAGATSILVMSVEKVM